jgi:hypothetical protein
MHLTHNSIPDSAIKYHSNLARFGRMAETYSLCIFLGFRTVKKGGTDQLSDSDSEAFARTGRNNTV